MTGASFSSIVGGALAAACFACGATAPADQASGGASSDASAEASPPPSVDASEGGLGVALTIAVGQYTGCSASTIIVAPNLSAVNGGNGTLTLAMNGGGFSAAPLVPAVQCGQP